MNRVITSALHVDVCAYVCVCAWVREQVECHNSIVHSGLRVQFS